VVIEGDDEGSPDEREIWQVTHVSEEVETTEGEEVDSLTQFLEVEGWPQVNDKETEKDLSWSSYCLINFVDHGLCFLIDTTESNLETNRFMYK
jgi:hypothetical protein